MPAIDRPPPLISVALCTYNGGHFLARQLDSILAQRNVSLEVIAVDDRSSDDSLALLREYARRDPRVQCHVNQETLGPTRNFERAMALCRGDFIAPSDQDDLWHPDKLTLLHAAIGTHDLAYCNSAYIDAAGVSSGRHISDDREMMTGFRPMRFVFTNSVSGHAMLLRRSLFELARPLPPQLYYDWVLAMAAAARNGIIYVDQPLVQFRRHERAYSSLGRSSHPRQTSRNRVWLDDRTRLLGAVAVCRVELEKRALHMANALAKARSGSSPIPLLRAIWRERDCVPSNSGWPALDAIRLQSRVLRKLRRARREPPTQ